MKADGLSDGRGALGSDMLGSLPSLVVAFLAALGVTRLAIGGLQSPRRMSQSELRRRLRRLL